jgi:transposase
MGRGLLPPLQRFPTLMWREREKPIALSLLRRLEQSHFAKPLQAWLTKHADESKVVCLPTYSPNLNAVVRFWKHMRRRVTHHHLFRTRERLIETVHVFFRDMAANPDVIRHVVGFTLKVVGLFSSFYLCRSSYRICDAR